MADAPDAVAILGKGLPMSTEEPSLRFELPTRVLGGYFAALATTSSIVVLVPLICGVATSVGQPRMLLLFLLILLLSPFLILFIAAFSFFFTLIPSFVFGCVYLYFDIKNVAYFVVSGVLTGLFVTVLLSQIGPLRQIPASLWAYVPFAFLGVVGGLSYWWLAVRQRRLTQNALAESA
jgi:hypothetical protein